MTSSRVLWLWSGLMTSALVAPVLLERASARLHAQASAGTAAPAAGSPQPAAPAPSAIAIVNARIIDASGNAPFDGTVVIRGDRIAEVGRSVKPPDGARVIDGQGRTVMPGLVDLVVELPKGATDDALARALGAYLYAGVTTIVPANLSASEMDALRDRLLRAGHRGPRLAIAPGADRLVRGSAAGGEGTANPLGGAQALMDWRQRNVTYVPELALAAPADRRAPTPLLSELTPADAPAAASAAASGGAASPERWKILVDQTRGARDAGVRLAVGSGAGVGSAHVAAGATGGAGANAGPVAGASAASGSGVGSSAAPGSGGGANLPHGWATLLAARLLVDAGLTPLQAVTAATSGGAWTLGLQSDRGFLAVGQRADLVVVNGDPSANIADLERIERVFLGGDEVDRAALRALITKPASAPPTAETTAGAATAKGARDPNPTGAPGRNARRGGRGAAGKRGAPEPAPAAEAGAPGTADPAAVASSPSSSSSAPAATAPAAGSPSTAPPAPGTPTSTAAAPNAATPATPAPASGAAPTAPNASATTSPGAPSHSRGGMSVVSAAKSVMLVTNPLIDDFEGTNDSSSLGSAWSSGGESANSSTMVVAGRVVKGLRDHALHLTARMGDARDSSARVTVKMTQDGRPIDVSRFHGLRFDARGQGRYLVIFVSRSVADGRYHESYFSGSPLWTPVSIPFASIGQTGNGQRVAWTGQDLIEIVFQIARDPGEMGWLELDNVRFY